MFKLLKETAVETKTNNHITIETYKEDKGYFTVAFIVNETGSINPRNVLVYEKTEKECLALITHDFFCQKASELSLDKDLHIIR